MQCGKKLSATLVLAAAVTLAEPALAADSETPFGEAADDGYFAKGESNYGDSDLGNVDNADYDQVQQDVQQRLRQLRGGTPTANPGNCTAGSSACMTAYQASIGTSTGGGPSPGFGGIAVLGPQPTFQNSTAPGGYGGFQTSAQGARDNFVNTADSDVSAWHSWTQQNTPYSPPEDTQGSASPSTPGSVAEFPADTFGR